MVYLPSKLFSYNASTQMFTAEASELDHVAQDGNWMDRIYNDAADAGFTMVSDRTGERVVFVHTEVTRNDDGDIESWDFKPTSESLRKFPHLKDCVLVVFND